MADANIIVAVDHAIDVIEYLFSVKQEASIREISVATGMSNSSVHRHFERAWLCISKSRNIEVLARYAFLCAWQLGKKQHAVG